MKLTPFFFSKSFNWKHNFPEAILRFAFAIDPNDGSDFDELFASQLR